VLFAVAELLIYVVTTSRSVVSMSHVGRDAWKKKYFEEKRKTAPLEEESKKLRNELDAANKKILAQMEKAHDGKQSSSAGQPSEQVHYTFTANYFHVLPFATVLWKSDLIFMPVDLVYYWHW